MTAPRRVRALPPALQPPPDRGRLLTAQQVADELLSATVSAQWVRDHVPGRVMLGPQTIRWAELEALAWIESRRRDG